MIDMKKMAGITLIELMVVISVVGITLAFGVPSMQNMIANNRSSSQSVIFVASLNLARSEAVKRGSTVFITATSGNWANGWNVWVDDNGNAAMDADEVLQTSVGLTGGNTMAETGGATELAYTSTGRITNTVTFDLTSASGNAAHDRRVTILPTGRVNVSGEI